MTIDYLSPANYGPGKSGPQIAWLRWRLAVHGVMVPAWGYAGGNAVVDLDNVRAFQLAQGWTGSDADGLPGPVTLRRLAAEPVNVPVPPTAYWPGDVLNLKPWKLTTPLWNDSHAAPVEWKQPVLDEISNVNVFHLNAAKDGVVFRAPANGAHTEHSHYPRCELREMNLDGSLAKWSNTDGKVHTMTMTAAVTHLPDVKPHVVAGQIHDADDDVVMVRLEGKRLFVERDGDEVGLLDADYRLGSKLRLAIRGDRGGVHVDYWRKDEVVGVGVSVPVTGSGWYFKAGMYVQAYAGQEHHGKTVPADTYGESVIYALSVEHRAAA